MSAPHFNDQAKHLLAVFGGLENFELQSFHKILNSAATAPRMNGNEAAIIDEGFKFSANLSAQTHLDAASIRSILQDYVNSMNVALKTTTQQGRRSRRTAFKRHKAKRSFSPDPFRTTTIEIEELRQITNLLSISQSSSQRKSGSITMKTCPRRHEN